MIKEIKYNGYTAQPSDYSCPDGDLSLSLGCIPDNGTIRPAFPPKVVLTLATGEDVIFIHKTSSYTHYIVYSGFTLKAVDAKDDTQTYTIGNVSNVTEVNAVGNTLIVLSPSGINYYLWKSGAYKSLGDHLPDVEISFGLVGYPKLYSQTKYSNNSTFTINFDGISEDDLYNEFSDENQAKITSQVMAKVNKFVAEETVHKGRFCFPFLVRYALRMYDGSLVCHSAPILMNPSTTSAAVVFWKHIRGKKSYNSAECDILLVPSALDYRFVRNDDFYSLGDWADIIKSVDVFISSPIYNYDQSGQITSFADSDNYNSTFIGRLDNTENTINNVASTSFLSHYMEYSYANIYSFFFSFDRSYPDKTLHMPEFSDDKVNDSVVSTANFFFIQSIDIDTAVAASKSGKRTTITLADDYLQSLVNREQLTDDYLTHDKLYPSRSFAYNQRLNLTGIKRNPFQGFLAESMLAYCDCGGYSYDVKEDATNAYSKLTVTAEDMLISTYSISVFIKEDGEDYMVSSSYSDISDSLSDFLSTNHTVTTVKTDGTKSTVTELTHRSWGCYFFYPNPNAYMMAIYNYGKLVYILDLKQHPTLNGAYATLPYGLQRTETTSTVPSVSPTGSNGQPRLIPNPSKVYTSAVNNPFFFPLSGINTVGTGTIIDICAAARPLSQGQFGQFPLYCFSSDGIWALEVGADGFYKARQPIARDVCTNPDSITQMDSSVIFVTDRGIMHISGSSTECLSDIIDTETPFDISSLPYGDAVLRTFKNFITTDANQAVNLPTDFSIKPFRTFLSGCRIVYDYTHQHIIVFNPSYNYAYVYSNRSQAWGMMLLLHRLTHSVNFYPDAMAMDADNRLVNFSEYGSTDEAFLLISRPLKLEAPDIHKTIDTIIQRGVFPKGNVCQVLYGSRDMSHWQLVWSSTNHYLRGFAGTAYKYYRLAVIGHLTDADSLYGATVQYVPRLTDQPR